MGARKLRACSPAWAVERCDTRFAAGPAHEGASPAMLKPFRRAAVRVVKPRVSEETWAKLREIDPQRVTPRLRPSLGQPGDSLLRATQLTVAATQLTTSGISTSNEVPASPCCRSASAGRFGTARAVHHCACGSTSSPRLKSSAWTSDDKSFLNEKRIITYQGSQVDADLLRSIARKHRHLKIIIDNGSHRPEHTRATFAILFPLLAEGGYYAIEDTRTSYWPPLGGSVRPHDPGYHHGHDQRSS